MGGAATVALRRRVSLTVRAVVALAFAFAVAPQAHAQDVRSAAAGLRDAPLYVDPSLRGALTAAERRSLVRRLRGRDPQVLVALLPLVPGDAVDGEPRQLLEVLRRRLGTDAVLATVDDGALVDDLGGRREDERLREAATVANLEGDYREPTVTTLVRYLDALDDPDVVARAARARSKLRSSPSPTPAAPGPADDDGVPGILIGLAVAVLLGAVATLAVGRRRARPAVDGPAVLPAHVFAAARDAHREQLRRTLDAELVAFADLLDRSPTPASGRAAERWDRALECRDVAALIARDPQARDVDLVGALVLEDAARLELAAATALHAGRKVPTPEAPCALNPTHPRSAARVTWGGAPQLRVCRECERDVRAGRRPDVLEDDGKAYLERDTPWAATAFGTLPGDLPAMVRADRAR